MTTKIPTTKRLPIDEVSPYWRNPRRIPSEAVEAVKASIAAYGYLQPLVVDENSVIIIGHTRYTALRKLGVDEVDVAVVDYLTPSQVKRLRVIDNRAGEYTTWDFDMLMEELALLGDDVEEADRTLLRGLFPEMDGEVDTSSESAQATEQAEKDWRYVVPEVEFVCPTCFHEWEQEVSRDQIMAGRIENTKETA